MLRRFLVVFAGALALGGLLAGSAFAAFSYPFAGQLAAGASFGAFEPNSVAVDDADGDTYVADAGAGVVHVVETGTGTQLASLDGSLTPAGSFGGSGVSVAANNATGDVYVLDSTHGVVDVFDAAGGYMCQITGSAAPSASECNGVAGSDTPEHGFSTPHGIAVDQATGEVYVVDANNGVVDVFSAVTAGAGGAYMRQISLASIEGFTASNTRGVAVDDRNGHVYVSDSDSLVVYEFNAAGEYLTRWTGANTPAGSFGTGYVSVAADNTTGSVLVTDSQHDVTDVFEPSGVYAGQISYPFEAAQGTAVDQATDEVYISDNGSGQIDIFGPPLVIPSVSTGAAGTVHPRTATLNGTVNPDGLQLTDCRFAYGTSTAYGQSAPCVPAAASIPADSNEHAVSAPLVGLAPDTTYHFRLQASNANGTSTGSQDQELTTAGPGIEHTSVVAVTSDSATLHASIDPNNTATTYSFQYGTSTSYGSQAPAVAAAVGAGKGEVEVSQPVTLTPGTVYHYRVVTRSEPLPGEPLEEPGPDRVFTTQSGEAPGLLDGRAWEMVSPPNKHGAALQPLKLSLGGLTQAAQDGSAISFIASAPVTSEPAGNRSLKPSQVLSTRGADGWVSRDIATPNERPWFVSLDGEYRWFNADLSVGVVEPEDLSVLVPGAAQGVPYLREADGSFTPLVFAAGLPAGSELNVDSGHGMFRGASPDLRHIVLTSGVPLLSGVPNNGLQGLYEWSGGSLQSVSVLPNERLAAEENEDPGLGGGGYGVRHAVSDDGSRVIWSTTGGGTHLYLRDMRLGRTVQLDAVEAGAQGGGGEALFNTASSDGSKVFFTDGARLTRDATGSPNQPDLYMCEVGEAAGTPTCRLKDLTVDANARESANVLGVVLGAGEDGRYVYFVADGALTPGAVQQGGCNGSLNQGVFCNLYVYDTVTSTTRLVAVLSGRDFSDWEGGNGGGSVLATVRVSPNGRFLAFMSTRSLTGYDNLDANSGQPDAEVFLYDVSTGRLVCASCDPSGARPTGVFDPPAEGESSGLLVDPTNASYWAGQWLAGSIPGWDTSDSRSSWYQSDYLSDSGRLFFNAADALVPGDINGKEDVYEYEPGGVGGCADVSGCVGLMSSGTSGEESALLDASESGNDVFFLTASRLAPQDVDSALDVYDAHVCSSESPCVAPPASSTPVVCASSDACRGAGAGQLGVFTAPASTTTAGAGNLAPPAVKPAVKTVKPKRLGRAQKLTSALRVCRRKHGRKQRQVCEARARRLYGKGAGARSARGAGASRKGKG